MFSSAVSSVFSSIASSCGKGNLVARAEKLKDLGAKASKSLPQELAMEENTEDTAEENIALLKRAAGT